MRYAIQQVGSIGRFRPAGGVYPYQATGRVWEAYGIGALAFLLGFLSEFQFRVVGTLNGAEPLAVAYIAWFALESAVRRKPLLPGVDKFRSQVIYVGLAVSAAGYVLSDLYWGTQPQTSAKGIARLVVLGIDTLALWILLLRHPTALWKYMVGVALGRVLVTILIPPLFDDYWKFGFALPVTNFSLILAAFLSRRHRYASAAILLGLAAAHGIFGFRAALLLILMFLLLRPFANRKGMIVVAAMGFAGVLAAALVFSVTEYGLRTSSTRSDIERKTHIQFCVDGIARHPLIGNGTWYTASGYLEHYYELLYRNSRHGKYGGFDLSSDALEISIHSQLLNSWCEAGLMGSAFFVAAFMLGLKDLITRPVVAHRPDDYLREYFLLEMILMMIFNPFSGGSRWALALQTYFLVNRPLVSNKVDLAAND